MLGLLPDEAGRIGRPPALGKLHISSIRISSLSCLDAARV